MKESFPTFDTFFQNFALQHYQEAEKGIHLAASGGYQYWYIDASLDSDKPSKWSTQRIDSLSEEIEKYKVKPLIHGNYKIPLGSDVDELRYCSIEYVKKEIDLAASLTSPLIIHGGVIVEPRLLQTVRRKALQNFLASLYDIYNYAIQKNVSIYLENLSHYKKFRPFSYIFSTEEEIDFILNEIDAKIFLDLGHANIGGESPKRLFEKYNKSIVGMSFSNNNGIQDQHLSLDKGTINYNEILNSILKFNWQGIVAFEIRDKLPSQAISELKNLWNLVSANHSRRAS